MSTVVWPELHPKNARGPRSQRELRIVARPGPETKASGDVTPSETRRRRSPISATRRSATSLARTSPNRQLVDPRSIAEHSQTHAEVWILFLFLPHGYRTVLYLHFDHLLQDVSTSHAGKRESVDSGGRKFMTRSWSTNVPE